MLHCRKNTILLPAALTAALSCFAGDTTSSSATVHDMSCVNHEALLTGPFFMVIIVVLLFTFLLWYKNLMLRREAVSLEKTRQQLTDANTRYQILVDNLPLSIYWKNTDLSYVSVNRVFAARLGKTPLEIAGKTDADLFSAETALRFQADDRQVLSSCESLETTGRSEVDGRERWLQITRTPLVDAATAKATGVLGILRDITGQKGAEEKLLEVQRFNESVLRSTLDMVYIYDIERDVVIYSNYHLSETLDYSAAEIVSLGSGFHGKLIHPDDLQVVNRLLAYGDMLDERASDPVQFRMHDRNGRWYWLLGRYTAFRRGADGRVLQVIGTFHDITERVRAEENLKVAFDRAQRYLDIVETVIIAMDRDGNVTLVNRKGLQLLGLNVKNITGKNWFAAVIADEKVEEESRFSAAMLSGDISQLEYHENRILTADGMIRTIAWHNSLLTDAEGKVCGMLCAGDDITVRKESDEMLKADKLRQNMLLNLNQLPALTNNQVMDYALDTALILTKSEIGYLYFYSEERQEFTLYSWSKNVMEQCRIMKKQTVYTLDKTGLWGEAVRQRSPIVTNEYDAENSYKKGIPTGHVPLVRHMNLPVFDGGKIVAVIGVGNKVADYNEIDVRHLQLLMDGIWKIKKRIDIEGEVRNLNEELERKVELRTGELRMAHGELERFFTLTPDLLCIASTDGVFIRCNNAWEHSLGYSGAYLSGKKFLEFVHPDDVAATEAQVNLLVLGKEIIDLVNRYRCLDGSYRWIEWRANVMGNAIYAAARDITEKKKNEEVLIKAREEADRANYAKSYFLANMSHEIRTPLNAVIGYSELVIGMMPGEKERGYIESIILAGRNLLTLINDILDLSKIEAGMMNVHLREVDVRNLVNEIEQIFSFKILEKKLAFSIEIAPELPRSIWFDEIRLRQILLNLTGNAIKFTDRGFIRIKVHSNAVSDPDELDELCIVVEDSGIGIEWNEIPWIFEAFHQPKEQSPHYGGTGLGLAISKKLVELLNGTITAQSIVGKGSSFFLNFKKVKVLRTDNEVLLSGKGSPDSDVDVDHEEKCRMVLPDDVITRANELLGAAKMDDLRLFAEDLCRSGNDLDLPQLVEIGNLLAVSAEKFDIAGVKMVLRRLIG